MITKECYHIYINGECIKANLEEDEFNSEMSYIKGFLELTNLEKQAKLEFERCDPPSYVEASF